MRLMPDDWPDLALIHGWGLGSAVWQPLLEPLARSCRPHPVELPGYGRAADDSADLAACAESLLATLPTPVTLCGWSLGGLLALRAALLAPQQVSGLILIGTTPCFVQRPDWPAAQPATLLAGFADSVGKRPAETLQRFVALLCQGDSQARTLTRTLLAQLRNDPLPALPALQRGLEWLRDSDLRPLLPGIRCRSLLLHGDSDALNPLAAAGWLARALPDSHLEVFPATGHAPFLADPARCSQLLSQFCHATRAH
ncbi:alpha/beta fold hydrolase [Accumulibacter sp.]|uniref:alpha/beta fold hydrolase n=1 Tax=Accumulibacter sp. TaxID=2053492 RepID=UPI0035B204FB